MRVFSLLVKNAVLTVLHGQVTSESDCRRDSSYQLPYNDSVRQQDKIPDKYHTQLARTGGYLLTS